MTSVELKALMALLMRSYPWPLNETAQRTLNNFVNNEAKKRGFMDWLDAYHKMR